MKYTLPLKCNLFGDRHIFLHRIRKVLPHKDSLIYPQYWAHYGENHLEASSVRKGNGLCFILYPQSGQTFRATEILLSPLKSPKPNCFPEGKWLVILPKNSVWERRTRSLFWIGDTSARRATDSLFLPDFSPSNWNTWCRRW